MAKDKITDYDAVASNNLDVGGISVAEGMLPSGVNNAMRELMSHQKEAFGSGTPLYVDQTNNRVGVNTASPSGVLAVTDGSNGLIVGQSTDNFHAANAHRFFTPAYAAERVRIDNDGLKFNGDTAQANALDDYEEGTWEATAVSGSGSLTTSTSYNDLAYKKIGSVVHVFGYIYVSSASSPSGALSVTGLPFTAGTGGADQAQMAVSVWLNGLAGTVAHPVARITGSTIQIFDWTGTVVTNTVASAFSSGGDIYLNATYSV